MAKRRRRVVQDSPESDDEEQSLDIDHFVEEKRTEFFDNLEEIEKKRSKSNKRAIGFRKIAQVVKNRRFANLAEDHQRELFSQILKTLNQSTQEDERYSARYLATVLFSYPDLDMETIEPVKNKFQMMKEEALMNGSVDLLESLLPQIALISLYHESHHDIHHQILPKLVKQMMAAFMAKTSNANVTKKLIEVLFRTIVHLIATFPTRSFQITWFIKLKDFLLQAVDSESSYISKVSNEFKLLVGEFFALCYESLIECCDELGMTWETAESETEDLSVLIKEYPTIRQLMKDFTGYISNFANTKDEKKELRISFRKYMDALTYYCDENVSMMNPMERKIEIAKQIVVLDTVQQSLIYDLLTNALGSVNDLFYSSETFCKILGVNMIQSLAAMNQLDKKDIQRDLTNQRSKDFKRGTIAKKSATRSRMVMLHNRDL